MATLPDARNRHVHQWRSMEANGVHWIGCGCGADSGQYELDQREQALADLEDEYDEWEASRNVIFEADLRPCDLCDEPGVGEDHPECLADEEGARFP